METRDELAKRTREITEKIDNLSNEITMKEKAAIFQEISQGNDEVRFTLDTCKESGRTILSQIERLNRTDTRIVHLEIMVERLEANVEYFRRIGSGKFDYVINSWCDQLSRVEHVFGSKTVTAEQQAHKKNCSETEEVAANVVIEASRLKDILVTKKKKRYNKSLKNKGRDMERNLSRAIRTDDRVLLTSLIVDLNKGHPRISRFDESKARTLGVPVLRAPKCNFGINPKLVYEANKRIYPAVSNRPAFPTVETKKAPRMCYDSVLNENVPLDQTCYIHGKCRSTYHDIANRLGNLFGDSVIEKKNKLVTLVAPCNDCGTKFDIRCAVNMIPRASKLNPTILEELITCRTIVSTKDWDTKRRILITRFNKKWKILSREYEFAKYHKIKMADLIPCQFPGCAEHPNGFLLANQRKEWKLSCLSCNATLCDTQGCTGYFNAPRGQQHNQMSCDEYAFLVQNGPEAASERMIGETSKSCPRCKSKTFKDGGCNHITCKICKAHWCWICGWLHVEGNHEGVYDHIRNAHQH